MSAIPAIPETSTESAAASPEAFANEFGAFTIIENVKGERQPLTPPAWVNDETINLPENSVRVLEKRYLRRDIEGALLETPAGMFYRIAWHIGEVDVRYGIAHEESTRTFYNLLTERRFYPNSPTFTGAGTPLGQLAACFVLPIADDMGRASDGIFSTLRVAALIQQTGGGNGFSFSRLRPKNDVVHTSSGRATGPVGFLRVYDQAFGEIAQGGSRRGANMGVLRVDHPDIEEFIECKAEEGRISNFNISVAITDPFMQAVRDDTDFPLINPRDGSVARTVRARALFSRIIKYAHHNGEPGALFIDAANRFNPVPHLYDLEATNPCVTADTLLYTANGLQRAGDLYASQQPVEVVLDSRFGHTAATNGASPVFHTGEKPVFALETTEGYSLKATGNHRIMTTRGWVELAQLQPGDKVHLLNRKGGFGAQGSLELGRALGWMLGDAGANVAEGAALQIHGVEHELAPFVAAHEAATADGRPLHNSAAPTHPIDAAARTVPGRGVSGGVSGSVSPSFNEELAALGITNRETLPEVVFTGSEAMQRGFLQALFTADGRVLDNGAQGPRVRLWSMHAGLLRDVQRLLLNFGVASRLQTNRRQADEAAKLDGRGGVTLQATQAGHELVIGKDNLQRFQAEIDFLAGAKQRQLAGALQTHGARRPLRESFVATVCAIHPAGLQPVFDLTEPLTHSFVGNGIVVHNCGEQWLGPYENCCLGSVNLAVHVKQVEGGERQVDWELLQRTVRESTRFLDNVVTANAYVPGVPQVAEAAWRARRIGLGIMGLGDLMYELGIRYGSDEGQEFAAQIMEFVRFHCMLQSIELAEARGPFLAHLGSIYDFSKPGARTWQPPVPRTPFSRDWQRPALDWEVIRDGIRSHGIRNAAQTTVAPTGTIATVCGIEGYGCEPVFALGYVRNFKDGDRNVELVYTSPLFERALQASALDEVRREEVRRHVASVGSCQELDDLPPAMRHTFVVSSDITAEEHVLMQAAIQAFVDNSISKTCNFPEGASEEDVAKAYMLAWETGCKGLTVYVTGSRQEVVLETKATRARKDGSAEMSPTTANGAGENAANGLGDFAIAGDEAAMANGHYPPEKASTVAPALIKRPRPQVLHGATYRKDTPLGQAYITLNSDEQNQPFEVFLNVGKAGSEVAAVSEAIGRLMSLVLRMPGVLAPSERLRWVMDEMAGIGGGRPLGFGVRRVRSLPDGVAQVLAEHLSGLPEMPEELAAEQLALPIGQRTIGDICPECGEAGFLNIEGCRKCHICGYSEC